MLCRAAWRRFGERLWPKHGGFGTWRTEAAGVTADPTLTATLVHADGARAEVVYHEFSPRFPGEVGPPPELLQVHWTGDDPSGPAAVELLAELGKVLTGADVAPPDPPLAGELRCELRSDETRWNLVGSGGQGDAVLQIVFRSPQLPGAEYRFYIARVRPEMRCFKRVGALALWYDHEEMDRDANEWARALMGSMKYLGEHPPGPGNAEMWRKVLRAAADKLGLSERFGFRADWSG